VADDKDEKERDPAMNTNTSLSIAIAALAPFLALMASPASAQSFRAEVHGGLDHLTNDVSKSGIAYGVGAGLDFRLAEKISAGVEVNADFSNVQKCAGGVVVNGDRLCVEAGRDLSAVARLGFDVAPRSTIYALAGYTNGRFHFDYKPVSGATTRESGNLDGLRLGIGFQQGLGGRVYSKVEYRYSNYEADTERHQLLAGIGVTF
jgi:outer membrane immunogenic protein